MKTFLVENKPDDYGNCRTELVHTTVKNSRQYYGVKQVDEKDVEILAKYLYLVDSEEEAERTEDERYYGNN